MVSYYWTSNGNKLCSSCLLIYFYATVITSLLLKLKPITRFMTKLYTVIDFMKSGQSGRQTLTLGF